SPLADEELVLRVEAEATPLRDRLAALEALRARARAAGPPSAFRRAAERAIAGPESALRNAGRDLLAALDPEAALQQWLEAAQRGEGLLERQHAWRRLGATDDARARAAIASGVAAWRSGSLDEAVGLD